VTFAQVLHGEKLWFLSPPSDKPVFNGDVTQMQVAAPSLPAASCLVIFALAQWLLQYAQLPQQVEYNAHSISAQLLHSEPAHTLHFSRQQPQSMMSCMLRPGHVLYIPPHWWHATLNLRHYNFFTSYFIQEATELLR
jgi:hypothetical protein